ncbi:MAG: hypothetical protein R3B53_02815 [Candidatus Paceibacterota bacterium]
MTKRVNQVVLQQSVEGEKTQRVTPSEEIEVQIATTSSRQVVEETADTE